MTKISESERWKIAGKDMADGFAEGLEMEVDETIRPGYARVDVTMSKEAYTISIHIEKKDTTEGGTPQDVIIAADAMFQALKTLG